MTDMVKGLEPSSFNVKVGNRPEARILRPLKSSMVRIGLFPNKDTKTKLITRNNMPPFLYDNEENQELTSIPSDNAGTLKEQTQRFQKNWILEALRKSNGVQKKAAQLLGVKPTTLNEMIKRMGIDINEIDG